MRKLDNYIREYSALVIGRPMPAIGENEEGKRIRLARVDISGDVLIEETRLDVKNAELLRNWLNDLIG